jgi:hypothetical protein
MNSQIVRIACSSSPGSCNFTDTFVVDTELSAPSNTVEMIALDVAGQTSPQSPASYSASIDPIITIDPAFVAQGFTLELSPGVSQPSAASVPEPATWAMMLAGFAGLAIAGFRRARRNRLVA